MTGNYADGHMPPERQGVRPATARLLRRLAARIDPSPRRVTAGLMADVARYVAEMNRADRERK